MNLLFLLGSGISYDAGLPCTSCLTRFLFDKNFQKMSYERFIETKSDCVVLKFSEINNIAVRQCTNKLNCCNRLAGINRRRIAVYYFFLKHSKYQLKQRTQLAVVV
jgi:hypothetical protein